MTFPLCLFAEAVVCFPGFVCFHGCVCFMVVLDSCSWCGVCRIQPPPPPQNRGRIKDATPPALPQWYYMAQVQGLCDIFQRDWCNLFVWTPGAAALFHMPRDAQYWAMCFEVLAEFWWEHVVPARHELEQGASAADVECFR